MKTAMQQLIEIIDRTEKLLENENNLAMSSALFSAKNMAELLLEKEKKQIKRAFEFGIADAYNFIDDDAEQYYNQTYNEKK
jgi:ElaB/YqjD/DUF883 family membrane-anchored ribosome-binding protein